MSPLVESFAGDSASSLKTNNTVAVITNSASNIAPTTATINGSINPANIATTYYFLYSASNSTTTINGQSVLNSGTAQIPASPASVPSGTTSQSLSQNLTGLNYSTTTSTKTYYYQIVAINSGGTKYGNIVSFNTSLPPVPTITSPTTSNASYGTVNIYSTVNPNGYDTTYYFAYTIDSSSANPSSLSSPTTTSPVDIGTGSSGIQESLAVTVSYGQYIHFQMVATNIAGEVTYGPITTAVSNYPPVPSATATNPSTTTTYSAVLSGNVNANYVGPGVTSYYFQIGTSSGNYNINSNFGGGNVSGTSNTPVSVTASLSAGVTYYWRIVATGPGGTTNSPELSFTMTPAVSLSLTAYHSYNSNSSTEVAGTTNRVITGFTVPSNGILVAKLMCVCTQTPSGGWVTDNLGGTWVQDTYSSTGLSSGFAGIFRRLDDGKYGQALTITANGGSTSPGGASKAQDMLLTIHYLANAKYFAGATSAPANNWFYYYTPQKAGSYLITAISGFEEYMNVNPNSYVQNPNSLPIYNYVDGLTSPEPSQVSGSEPSVQNYNNGNSFYGWTTPISTSSNFNTQHINVGFDTSYYLNAVNLAIAEYSSY